MSVVYVHLLARVVCRRREPTRTESGNQTVNGSRVDRPEKRSVQV